MFDFRDYRGPIWPKHLKPEGEGTPYQEDFEPWWQRHSVEFSHLHPLLAEQWIHRHWSGTDFAFLPIETLRWQLASRSGDEILRSVRREIDTRLEPEIDYDQFQGLLGFDKFQTAIELDEGTWKHPIVALSTPSGWRSRRQGDLPKERLMLVEGHLRHRYLNALHAKGIPPKGPHQLFILYSPLVV